MLPSPSKKLAPIMELTMTVQTPQGEKSLIKGQSIVIDEPASPSKQ